MEIRIVKMTIKDFLKEHYNVTVSDDMAYYLKKHCDDLLEVLDCIYIRDGVEYCLNETALTLEEYDKYAKIVHKYFKGSLADTEYNDLDLSMSMSALLTEFTEEEIRDTKHWDHDYDFVIEVEHRGGKHYYDPVKYGEEV